MLILMRKKGERIHVGETVMIQVVKLGGDQVWIGIKAPKDVNIVREELLLMRRRCKGNELPAGEPRLAALVVQTAAGRIEDQPQ